jgi:hypothetical protein
MGKRYRRAGASLRPVHKLRMRMALEMGRFAEAKKSKAAWQKAKRDRLCDCFACEQNDLVEYLLVAGKDKEALEKAQPILWGRLSCMEIPHITFALVLLPLLRQGRDKEAADYHRRGYRLISGNRAFVPQAAHHLRYLMRIGAWARAVKGVEHFLPLCLDVTSVLPRFKFFLVVLVLCERLLEQGKTQLKARLPKAFPLYRKDGTYDLNELVKWFQGELRELAGRFDERNGNSFVSEMLAGRAEFLK